MQLVCVVMLGFDLSYSTATHSTGSISFGEVTTVNNLISRCLERFVWSQTFLRLIALLYVCRHGMCLFDEHLI